MSKAMAPSQARVQYKDLREYLKLLESAGLLHRIKAEVDLYDEIGAIPESARTLCAIRFALCCSLICG